MPEDTQWEEIKQVLISSFNCAVEELRELSECEKCRVESLCLIVGKNKGNDCPCFTPIKF